MEEAAATAAADTTNETPAAATTATRSNNTRPPLLFLESVMSSKYNGSYDELVVVLKNAIGSDDSILPTELCEKACNFFLIEPVKSVKVIGCSSQSAGHGNNNNNSKPLECCLEDSEDTWWISAPDSMINGLGREYVEFDLLTTGQTKCRLRSVSLKIPPLPQGPLSVRCFHLEDATTDDDTPLTRTLIVANRLGWQRFDLNDEGGDSNPIDVSRIRLVCTSNQMSLYPNSNDRLRYSSVGFYTVRFD